MIAFAIQAHRGEGLSSDDGQSKQFIVLTTVRHGKYTSISRSSNWQVLSTQEHLSPKSLEVQARCHEIRSDVGPMKKPIDSSLRRSLELFWQPRTRELLIPVHACLLLDDSVAW